ncbi:uncharacterized protein [Parasteatoda tepidariorum]|uniref:uncharacterized protein n=1 Tax=Parasteatoda tepidariorum TaxID=114398 RepID=UPI0039BC49BF
MGFISHVFLTILFICIGFRNAQEINLQSNYDEDSLDYQNFDPYSENYDLDKVSEDDDFELSDGDTELSGDNGGGVNFQQSDNDNEGNNDDALDMDYMSNNNKDNEYSMGQDTGDVNNFFQNSENEGFNFGNPGNEGFNFGKPEDEGFNFENPEDEGFNFENPDYEGSNFGNPEDEGFSFENPEYEGSNFGNPEDEGFNFENPEYEGSNFGNPGNGFNFRNLENEGFNFRNPNKRNPFMQNVNLNFNRRKQGFDPMNEYFNFETNDYPDENYPVKNNPYRQNHFPGGNHRNGNNRNGRNNYPGRNKQNGHDNYNQMTYRKMNGPNGNNFPGNPRRNKPNGRNPNGPGKNKPYGQILHPGKNNRNGMKPHGKNNVDIEKIAHVETYYPVGSDPRSVSMVINEPVVIRKQIPVKEEVSRQFPEDPYEFDEMNVKFRDIFVTNILSDPNFGTRARTDFKQVTHVMLKAISLLQTAETDPSQKDVLMVSFAATISELIIVECDDSVTLDRKVQIVTRALRNAYLETTGKPNEPLIREVKLIIGILLEEEEHPIKRLLPNVFPKRGPEETLIPRRGTQIFQNFPTNIIQIQAFLPGFQEQYPLHHHYVKKFPTLTHFINKGKAPPEKHKQCLYELIEFILEQCRRHYEEKNPGVRIPLYTRKPTGFDIFIQSPTTRAPPTGFEIYYSRETTTTLAPIDIEFPPDTTPEERRYVIFFLRRHPYRGQKKNYYKYIKYIIRKYRKKRRKSTTTTTTQQTTKRQVEITLTQPSTQTTTANTVEITLHEITTTKRPIQINITQIETTAQPTTVTMKDKTRYCNNQTEPTAVTNSDGQIILLILPQGPGGTPRPITGPNKQEIKFIESRPGTTAGTVTNSEGDIVEIILPRHSYTDSELYDRSLVFEKRTTSRLEFIRRIIIHGTTPHKIQGQDGAEIKIIYCKRAKPKFLFTITENETTKRITTKKTIQYKCHKRTNDSKNYLPNTLFYG